MIFNYFIKRPVKCLRTHWKPLPGSMPHNWLERQSYAISNAAYREITRTSSIIEKKAKSDGYFLCAVICLRLLCWDRDNSAFYSRTCFFENSNTTVRCIALVWVLNKGIMDVGPARAEMLGEAYQTRKTLSSTCTRTFSWQLLQTIVVKSARDFRCCWLYN